MAEVSFKRLTAANWREPDPVCAHFARVSPIAGVVQMDGDGWARSFLAIELKEQVPDDVRQLFAVARGTALYGWFFYPLFRLAEEQLFRVIEAAARARYRQLGGSDRRPRFHDAIEELVARAAIDPADRIRWDAARELRNAGSHAESQSVMPPGHVLRTFNLTAHDINRLFTRGRPGESLGGVVTD